MSEQTNIPQGETSQEATPPTKEQVIEFMQEQIEVKTVQVELQKLNTQLATLKAEELKALSFIGQMTAPEQELQDHVVTQEDLDNNPELAENGVELGDTIQIPMQKERKLKKK